MQQHKLFLVLNCNFCLGIRGLVLQLIVRPIDDGKKSFSCYFKYEKKGEGERQVLRERKFCLGIVKNLLRWKIIDSITIFNVKKSQDFRALSFLFFFDCKHMHAHWNECEFKIWNFKCFSTLLKYREMVLEIFSIRNKNSDYEQADMSYGRREFASTTLLSAHDVFSLSPLTFPIIALIFSKALSLSQKSFSLSRVIKICFLLSKVTLIMSCKYLLRLVLITHEYRVILEARLVYNKAK